jgi:hypothetical protein
MPFISSIRKNFEPKKSGVLDKFDITGGDTVITSGGYRIHMFTTTGDSEFSIKPKFEKTDVINLASSLGVEYLVIAGGGGAGGLRGPCGIGGAGAGGYRSGGLTLPANPYTVTVGAGGTGSQPDAATNGGNSVFSSITSVGGGRGRMAGGANPGGSGGGGGYLSGFEGYGVGTSGQGYPGGSATTNPPVHGGSGGGGAGGSGMPGVPIEAGRGGAGSASSITGTVVVRGGGGGAQTCGPTGSAGGPGGGGPGHPTLPAQGGDGVANTGGGGGAGVDARGGNGGPGIVVARYLI